MTSGNQFDAVLPPLWLAAGGVGGREEGASDQSFSMPTGATYAVLFREANFGDFRKATHARTSRTCGW